MTAAIGDLGPPDDVRRSALPHRRCRTRWRERLQSPLALVADGFILGCILQFALQPSGAEPAAERSDGPSILSNLQV